MGAPMNWWVYKNNSTDHTTSRLQGDWHDFFDADRISEWGYRSQAPSLGEIKVDDRILCYQSNRNELVGIARAARWKKHEDDRHLYLEPMRRLEVRVRPLKDRSPAVARIDAFRPGPVRTLTAITPAEVRSLFEAIGFHAIPKDLAACERQPIDPERAYVEGHDLASRSRSRNRRLVAAAKSHYGTKCYCCQFDFGSFYGGKAQGLCVVHHLDEFRGGRGTRSTKVADVRVICANCHIVLHIEQPAMQVETLRRIVARRRGDGRL